eukprot:TRINITY_DN128_c1_g1_i2.p1 TRINITY_DN128_c1_g1~~TRINITY_DN128_c1_g1_i2.p1  ORF type:complete len:436 (+),score=123.41 TRINITY_DN128_c1_g1_i2:64-1371(+)
MASDSPLWPMAEQSDAELSALSPRPPRGRKLMLREKYILFGAGVALVMTAAMILALIIVDQREAFDDYNSTEAVVLKKRHPDGYVLLFMGGAVALLLFVFNVAYMERFRHHFKYALEDTLKRHSELTEGYYFACNRYTASNREEPAPPAPLKERARLLAWTLWANLVQLPPYVNFVLVVLALLVVGFGALGFMLMVRMAHMPDKKDDPAWTEVAWQVICAVFTLVAVYRHPMRARFLGTLVSRRYLLPEFRGEGTGPELRGRYAALLFLTVKDAWILCGLRHANCIFQYIVCIFMWGWLPRCWEEERQLYQDCKSRPPWAVPLFLVLSMGSDIAANVFKGKKIDELKRDFEVVKLHPGEYERQKSAATLRDQDAGPSQAGAASVAPLPEARAPAQPKGEQHAALGQPVAYGSGGADAGEPAARPPGDSDYAELPE